MQTPLEIIESYGAPTNSFIAAVNYFRYERGALSKEEHESGIANIIGTEITPTFTNEKEAEMYFLYAVQETIRAFSGGNIPDMSDVWSEVQRRATHFINENPWSIKTYASEEEVIEDAEGNKTVKVKRKKGAKKEQSAAIYKKLNDGTNDRNTIIDAFINDLGMSKAGATTYFHNLKKKFGYAGPKVEKPKREKKVVADKPKAKKATRKKGPSKGAIASEVYASMPGADKADVIAKIIEKTGTSPAGANTYYCAAKKELG